MRWTLALWAVSLFVGSAAAQFSGLPAGISSRLLFSPLREPTDACAFAPLGATGQTHAFIVTQPGKLLLYNGTRMVQFADLGKSRNLVYEGESGLLACVADSSAIWLFYSVPSAHVVSRIPFTLNPARLLLAQEKRLVVMPRVATQHTGGALAWFREAGRRYLLIARGDDARCDYSSGPECAAILSKSDYRGKILRVDPMTGNGAPSNPLYKASTPSSATSRLFADGLRNPWAMSQVPGNNPRVAIWDVGGDYREMLKVLGKNEFGGWPCREGTKSHNPGLCTAAQNASISKRLFDYTHTNGESCIIGGTFIPSSFRPSLRNRMLYSDYGSGRFWTGTISTAGYPVDRKDFGRLYGVIRVVRGPSGRLWAISFGQAGIWELWDSTPGAK